MAAATHENGPSGRGPDEPRGGSHTTERQADHTASTGAVHPYSAMDRWRAPDDFAAAIVGAGLGSPGAIIADGQVHRFQVEGDKSGTRNGWFSLHLDGVAAGAFGSWKSGEVHTWCSVARDQLTADQRADLRRVVERAKAERQAADAARHAAGAAVATALWTRATPADPAHPYLIAKAIGAHGVRQHGPRLVIPVTIDGALSSLQTIDPERTPPKRFLKGGRIAGGWYLIETAVTRPEVLLCEGFATGATLHEQTGARTYCAFAAGNLLAVARAVRTRHPSEAVIVCADHDAWTPGNPGVTKGREAALAIGAKLLVPDFTGLDLSGKPTDYNDWYRLRAMAGRGVA